MPTPAWATAAGERVSLPPLFAFLQPGRRWTPLPVLPREGAQPARECPGVQLGVEGQGNWRRFWAVRPLG